MDKCILLLTLFTVNANNLFLLHQPNFNDLYISDYLTLESLSQIRTLTSCAYRCVINRGCVSVFYDKNTKQCDLKSVLYPVTDNSFTQIGSRYYSVYEEGCPKDFIRNRKYHLCYKPYFDTIEWIYDGMSNCDVGGYVLLRANTVEAYRHVSDQLMVTPEGDGYGYYVDGSDEYTEGHWIFEDGTPMTAFIWGDNEPDNSTYSDFIYLKRSNGKYIMSDTQNELYGDYICQKRMNEEENLIGLMALK
ncbi:hypothetical protein LOTGIDRAFT_167672 [Lottia gigantea]|uniref:Apple domain-containing protein n=1 Tax=Lottia gigantea TaxID=225164 RepID=V3ZTQ2_LOTGI|nr:hypothetical protein LOTGIDRAFT_167672 [Lottia gigantea]ESO85915.1 hypothetical protein LOTGIDRAFT_167672 [Lottia gigantea]